MQGMFLVSFAELLFYRWQISRIGFRYILCKNGALCHREMIGVGGAERCRKGCKGNTFTDILRMFEPLIREARHTIAVKLFYFTITGYLEE